MYSVCRAGGRVAATIPAPTSVGRRSAIIATFPSLFASLPEKIDIDPNSTNFYRPPNERWPLFSCKCMY
jgi:hypothetical protein